MDKGGKMIDGVIIEPLKQIADPRGKVLHMIRSDSKNFTKFGEIYFSSVNSRSVKAWRKHKLMTQHFAVPMGEILLVLYDDRERSSTKGEIQEVHLGGDNYNLVRIPPLVWYGFKGISIMPALIANCTDIPHDPSETEKFEFNDLKIPYQW